MADRNAKTEHNVEGEFYVDQNCIACAACVSEAPDFIAIDEDEACAYFYRQPTDHKEYKQCKAALLMCPVGAIGNDGTEES